MLFHFDVKESSGVQGRPTKAVLNGNGGLRAMVV